MARPTLEAKDARERTQICTASFPLKNDLLLRNEEGVWKLCRTFAPQNIWLNVRRRGNPRSIFVEHSAKLPLHKMLRTRDGQKSSLRLDFCPSRVLVSEPLTIKL